MYNRFLFRTLFFNRSSCIPKCIKRKSLCFYKIKKYFLIKQSNLNSGYKFGEFLLSRKPYYYPQKERGKKKKSFKR